MSGAKSPAVRLPSVFGRRSFRSGITASCREGRPPGGPERISAGGSMAAGVLGTRPSQTLILSITLILATVAGVSSASSATPSSHVHRALSSHSPILIEGDGQFTPSNGVVSGNGTPADPFIIAGWEMLLSGPPGVEIRNTTASFVIRDLILTGTFDGAYDGVILRNAANARIENVTSEHNRVAILLDKVRLASVVGNKLSGNHRGIHVFSSSEVVIARNEATGGPWGLIHILIVDSNRITIKSNRVTTYGVAFGAAHSDGLELWNNTVQSMGDGILFDNITEASVALNDFTAIQDLDFSALGFDLHSSRNVSLSTNSFRGYGADRVDESTNITIDGNT